MSYEQVEFQTTDRVKIVGDFYPVAGSGKGLILVHMMPATRKSWEDFAQKAQAALSQTLAIDLRGHGDSGGGNYQRFSDAEHQASIADLAAAAKFLSEKGIAEISLAGASIGANLSLQYLAENPEIKAVVLLSPGVDFRGIQIEPLAAKIADKQRILLAAANDDASSMGGNCEEIAAKLGGPARICYEDGGHGTNLLQFHLELADKILNFLNK